MSETVLIMGSAGFIGAQVADELPAAGRRVPALAGLSPDATRRLGTRGRAR